MIVFGDASALVKIYADEPESELIRGIPSMVVSQIARVEVPSAIWRKARCGELSGDEAALLVADFEADYYGTADGRSRFIPVDITVVVLEAAARLARRHYLRSGDAIQLASAVLAAEADPDITGFAAWDKRLREAAATEGFTLIPA
ncbi:PIN domain-containing protein [Kibdelosporangium aridum]|uniref:PIN domain-containing protein n=1 Tax=Kibdelosporangium aridum TaxID=2030 RepID=A0A428ZFP8_KIBAR|nr:type II toxin-antitoxin system VapC family toxin [Kibdelosporangium aridum]RSM86922.1 PIN domain-containing protein [Kibdelosporangium aridum]